MEQEQLRGYVVFESKQELQREWTHTLSLLPSYVLFPVARGIFNKGECLRCRTKSRKLLPNALKIEVRQANLRYHRVWALEQARIIR